MTTKELLRQPTPNFISLIGLLLFVHTSANPKGKWHSEPFTSAWSSTTDASEKELYSSQSTVTNLEHPNISYNTYEENQQSGREKSTNSNQKQETPSNHYESLRINSPTNSRNKFRRKHNSLPSFTYSNSSPKLSSTNPIFRLNFPLQPPKISNPKEFPLSLPPSFIPKKTKETNYGKKSNLKTKAFRKPRIYQPVNPIYNSDIVQEPLEKNSLTATPHQNPSIPPNVNERAPLFGKRQKLKRLIKGRKRQKPYSRGPIIRMSEILKLKLQKKRPLVTDLILPNNLKTSSSKYKKNKPAKKLKDLNKHASNSEPNKVTTQNPNIEDDVHYLPTFDFPFVSSVVTGLPFFIDGHIHLGPFQATQVKSKNN